jgi:hypothetical protein
MADIALVVSLALLATLALGTLGAGAWTVISAVRAQTAGRPEVGASLAALGIVFGAVLTLTALLRAGLLDDVLRAGAGLCLLATTTALAARAAGRRRRRARPPLALPRSYRLADDLTRPLAEVIEAAEAEAPTDRTPTTADRR